MRPPEAKGPIRITGVVTEELTKPRNDGTRGSGLYAVPFRLSRRPSQKWAERFVENWRRPPVFGTMHRPRIARVSGDKVVLDGTTLEEVERHHQRTLKLVLDKTNEQVARWEESEQARLKKQGEDEEARRQAAGEISRRLRFD